MNKISYSCILTLVVFVVGCYTAKPMVRMEEDISLSRYKVIEVMPTSNETGKTIDSDVEGLLSQKIKSSLRDKGYTVAEGANTSEGILVIKSSLITYEPGSAFERWLLPGAGKTQATVRTSLIDKKTGKLIGEMVTAEAISGGGVFSVGAYKRILEVIGEGIATELDKKFKSR